MNTFHPNSQYSVRIIEYLLLRCLRGNLRHLMIHCFTWFEKYAEHGQDSLVQSTSI